MTALCWDGGGQGTGLGWAGGGGGVMNHSIISGFHQWGLRPACPSVYTPANTAMPRLLRTHLRFFSVGFFFFATACICVCLCLGVGVCAR